MPDVDKKSLDSDLDWTGEPHIEPPSRFDYTTIVEYQIVRDIELREKMADRALALFKDSNKFVLTVVAALVFIDLLHTVAFGKDESFRIVNENVILALIGATTVQLGAIALVIFRSLFDARGQQKK